MACRPLFVDSSIPFAETMEASANEITATDVSGKAILSSDYCLVLLFLFHILIYNHHLTVYITLHNHATWDIFGGGRLRVWVNLSQGKSSFIIHPHAIPNSA